CRTGHAFIGEYYAKFVPTEDVSCQCEEGVFQTRYHILTECPRYDEYRHILTQASPTLFLPDILGTDEGILALAQFLEKSGAFTKTGNPRETKTVPLLEDEDGASEEEGWDQIVHETEEEEEEEEE
ncbi:hypothetical protein PLICRDRAFT_72046, partial [Plicaturopsis crispa FD-325 SS-3]